MNAEKWAAGDDPQAMIEWLLKQYRYTCHHQRKLRLLVCALLRAAGVSYIGAVTYEPALVAAEHYADTGDTRPQDGWVHGTWVNESVGLESMLRFIVLRPPSDHPALDNKSVGHVIHEIIGPWDVWDQEDGSTVGHNGREGCLVESIVRPTRGVHFTPLPRHITELAQTCYADRTWESLPILGDMLEEFGVTNQQVLSHLRTTRQRKCNHVSKSFAEPRQCNGGRIYTGIDNMKWIPCPACGGTGTVPDSVHFRGCWVLDRLLGQV